ncbi:MAG: histidine triad nucleotide-binding protein [Chloroflexota bacterium]|nr:MAG: histidine triad nucleotide-binding protein [Chloroflexota bacterium]
MNDCLFCSIVQGHTPADIVYQDEDVLAFRDIHPKAPVHVLVIPRKHVRGYRDAEEKDEALLGRLARAAASIAESEGTGAGGFRVVVNSGADAGQSVDHLHLHVLGGAPMGWPPWPSG